MCRTCSCPLAVNGPNPLARSTRGTSRQCIIIWHVLEGKKRYRSSKTKNKAVANCLDSGEHRAWDASNARYRGALAMLCAGVVAYRKQVNYSTRRGRLVAVGNKFLPVAPLYINRTPCYIMKTIPTTMYTASPMSSVGALSRTEPEESTLAP